MFINDNYEIRSLDDRNIALIEHGVVKSGKNEGAPSEKTIGYYPDVAAALKGLAKREIHGTGLRDLELINVKIKQLYEYIDKVVKVNGE